MNTTDGLTKAMSSGNLRCLLAENSSRIVTEVEMAGIRKRLPVAKHYTVYPETTQGQKDCDKDMRRKTRAGRSSHWHTLLGGKPPLNSNKLHIEINPKRTISKEKPNRISQRFQNKVKI